MSQDDSLHEKVLERTELFQGRYLHLDKLKIRLPNGENGIREIVKVPDAVAVLPMDQERIVHLVRQHRPAIGKTILEIPAGIIDPGETSEVCARRECEEETGMLPGKLTDLMTYAHAEGYSTGYLTLFLGEDLRATGNIQLDRTEFVEQVSLPFSELLDRVKAGDFIDSKTILCTLLVERKMAEQGIL